jgi:hypothetical protein
MLGNLSTVFQPPGVSHLHISISKVAGTCVDVCNVGRNEAHMLFGHAELCALYMFSHHAWC